MGYYKNKRQKHKRFVGFLHELYVSPEWLSLPNCSKLAYPYFKRNFNGSNNGQIKTPYKELKFALRSPATISKAIKGLENGKWIEKTKQGGLYHNASEYRITFLHDKFGRDW